MSNLVKFKQIDNFLSIVFTAGDFIRYRAELGYMPDELPKLFIVYINTNLKLPPQTIAFDLRKILLTLDEINQFKNNNQFLGNEVRATLKQLEDLKQVLNEFKALEYISITIKGFYKEPDLIDKGNSLLEEWTGVNIWKDVLKLGKDDRTEIICKDRKMSRKEIEQLILELEQIKYL